MGYGLSGSNGPKVLVAEIYFKTSQFVHSRHASACFGTCFLRHCLLSFFFGVATAPLLWAQDVVEIYSEKGVVIDRYRGGLDSVMTHLSVLPKSRYVVSLSIEPHSDTTLTRMSLRCLFNDAFCQLSDPLEPDTVYEAIGFYDGHWISVDRRSEAPHLLWEKHVMGGNLHGLCVVYGDTHLPVYMANFQYGRLDGLASRHDYRSGYYSSTLYRAGVKVRTISWATDGRVFFDSVWKPTLPP